MDRLESVFLNPDDEVRERNLEMFRDKIYDKLIIKKEHFPDSYFELQKRIAHEQGHGEIQISEAMREQMMDTAIEDQKHSLNAWIDYLSSDDAVYPPWFKYYAWNQVIKLSQFDKERGEFKKRTNSTVAPFPDIYREPLAQIADLYERVKDDNKDSEARKEFDKKFPSLYAERIQESLAASMENREEIRGEWVKYEQGDGTAAQKLFASLEGKGTGWCTAGRSTAETQIDSGDFYVYYTNDSSGEPTQPRLAIRMNGTERIREVRGVLPHQEVEPMMQEVLDTKLGEFGSEADVYRKKSEDMRRLTALEHKHEKGEPFTKDDLTFLYEIGSTIEGFGYDKDPRIAELRKGRDIVADLEVLFDVSRETIASNLAAVNEQTKLLAMDMGGPYRLSQLSYDELHKVLALKDIELFDMQEMKAVRLKREQPKKLDWKALAVYDRSKYGELYCNPEAAVIDWENVPPEKIKQFDFKEFVGKPRWQLAQHVAEEYGDEYIIPGLDYQKFLYEHPDKAPQAMKDYRGGYFYFFGSLLRYSDGSARVPGVDWGGERLDRHADWLDGDWDDVDRVLLLEK